MKNLPEIFGVILFSAIIMAVGAPTKISNRLPGDSIQRESAGRLMSELNLRSVALGLRDNHPITVPVLEGLIPAVYTLNDSAEQAQTDTAILLEPSRGMQ